MKVQIITAILLLFFQYSSIKAQNNSINLGVKVGVNTLDVNPNSLLVINKQKAEEFNLAVTNANYGFHFGVQIPIVLGSFILQPEVQFNSNSVEYNYTDIVSNRIFKETYNHLDLPLMLGYKGGIFRVMGGPVGHVLIHNKSDLFDIEGYSEKFKELVWGYQLGLGLTISKFTLDLRYEGNLYKFGSHINFFGQQYNFDKSPSKFILSVGYLLF